MKSARFIEPGKIILNYNDDKPLPKPDEVVIKVTNSGICGTDFHIYKGEVKGLVESGVVLGHEFSGVIDSVGEDAVNTFNIGEKVAVQPNLYCGHCHFCRNAKKHFCENWAAIGLSRDGGFEEYVAVPASAVYKVPNNLSLEAAAFFEPMACVLHGIERSHLKPGETVVLQGVGSIGLLYLQALKRLGAGKIIVADLLDDKLNLAKSLGADLIVNPKNENLKEVVSAETNGIGAQVLIDAAGVPNTINTGLSILENTGRIVIFGVPPENAKIEISPYEIYRREIEIIGSFTNPYTNEAALTLLKEIDITPILTNKITLDHLVDEGMDKFGKQGVIKIQIQF